MCAGTNNSCEAVVSSGRDGIIKVWKPSGSSRACQALQHAATTDLSYSIRESAGISAATSEALCLTTSGNYLLAGTSCGCIGTMHVVGVPISL